MRLLRGLYIVHCTSCNLFKHGLHVCLSTCCSIFSASLMGSILYTICLNTVGFMAPGHTLLHNGDIPRPVKTPVGYCVTKMSKSLLTCCSLMPLVFMIASTSSSRSTGLPLLEPITDA